MFLIGVFADVGFEFYRTDSIFGIAACVLVAFFEFAWVSGFVKLFGSFADESPSYLLMWISVLLVWSTRQAYIILDKS